MFVAGNAGIGKSALVASFTRTPYARHGRCGGFPVDAVHEVGAVHEVCSLIDPLAATALSRHT